MVVFCVCRVVFSFVIFSLFSRLTSCVFSFDIAREISLEQTNKKKKTVKKKNNNKKNSYASLTEFYPITSTPYYSLSNAWIGLNFIRIFRVVISPSVTSLLRGEKDSKQSDEIQATATQAVDM